MAGQVKLDRRYVQPGQIVVCEEPTALQAVVGPAVAICLWDTKRKMGGMAHCPLPQPGNGERATSRFASVAVPMLIRKLAESGSQRADLVAKVFGGGRRRVSLARTPLGKENSRAALEALAKEMVPVIAEDLGGKTGRRLIYLTGENRIKVLRTKKIREADWETMDRD